MQLHESKPRPPGGFVDIGTPSSDTILTLRISLVQKDPDGLTDALLAVSDPASSQYGQHLTQEQVLTPITHIIFSRELTFRPIALSGQRACEAQRRDR